MGPGPSRPSWRSVRDGVMACTPEESMDRGLDAFLSHLALGKALVSSLERITLIGVDADGREHLMHSLFFIRVDLYSTECRLFAYLGELPAGGLPPMTEISPGFFAARREGAL